MKIIREIVRCPSVATYTILLTKKPDYIPNFRKLQEKINCLHLTTRHEGSSSVSFVNITIDHRLFVYQRKRLDDIGNCKNCIQSTHYRDTTYRLTLCRLINPPVYQQYSRLFGNCRKLYKLSFRETMYAGLLKKQSVNLPNLTETKYTNKKFEFISQIMQADIQAVLYKTV